MLNRWLIFKMVKVTISIDFCILDLATPVCVSMCNVYCCCFTSVNYALIRHVFLRLYCTAHRHRLQLMHFIIVYSVMQRNALQFCSISRIEQCLRRQKNVISHRNAHIHMHACMHAYTKKTGSNTNHNGIEKGVTPIQNIVDAVLIVVHNL